MKAKLLLVSAFLALACGTGAGATAGGVRTISSARTDSTCIGNPSDPVCALETLFACKVLGRPDLCAEVGLRGLKPFRGYGIAEYKIVTVRPITSEPIPPRLHRESWYRRGNVVIRVRVRWC